MFLERIELGGAQEEDNDGRKRWCGEQRSHGQCGSAPPVLPGALLPRSDRPRKEKTAEEKPQKGNLEVSFSSGGGRRSGGGASGRKDLLWH